MRWNLINKLINAFKTSKYILLKSKKYHGYTPPPSKDLSEEEKRVLAEVYAKCRSKQKVADKETCAKIAWGAVHRLSKDIQKRRIYIKDPSKTPEGVKLQRGKRGGLYYDTEDLKKPGETEQEVDEKHTGRNEQGEKTQTVELPDYAKGNVDTYGNLSYEKQGNIGIWKGKTHIIKINESDLPDNIDYAIFSLKESTATLKFKKRIEFNFLGKSVERELNYVDADGNEHKNVQTLGTATLTENKIKIYDDYKTADKTVRHEIGHLIYNDLFKVFPMYAEDMKKEHIAHIDSIEKYHDVLDIVKKYDAIDKIKDIYESNDERFDKLRRELIKQHAHIYEDGYSILSAINDRHKDNMPLEIDNDTIKKFKAYRKDREGRYKSPALLGEWKKNL